MRAGAAAYGCKAPSCAAMADAGVPLGVRDAGEVGVGQEAQTEEVSVVGNSQDGETGQIREGQTDVLVNGQLTG